VWTFAQIGTVASNILTFVDTTVTTSPANATYSYRVAAVNGNGTSAFSNTASMVIPAVPAAPGNFIAVNGVNAKKTRSVNLTWADQSNNETGFTIQRATNSLFTQGLASIPVAANSTSLTVSGLNINAQYWFRIQANNGTFISSVWVSANPSPIRTNP
jgi:hypothetical protein